jgi:hypothetical protein
MTNSLLGDILNTGKAIYDDGCGIRVYKYKGIYFSADQRKTVNVVEHENRKTAIVIAKMLKDWCPI